MSERASTKGPWEVQRHRQDGTGPFLVRGIARGIAWEIDSEADAYLIAAAPDLLAALQDALRTLEAANIAGKGLSGSCVAVNARAALTKASINGYVP